MRRTLSLNYMYIVQFIGLFVTRTLRRRRQSRRRRTHRTLHNSYNFVINFIHIYFSSVRPTDRPTVECACPFADISDKLRVRQAITPFSIFCTRHKTTDPKWVFECPAATETVTHFVCAQAGICWSPRNGNILSECECVQLKKEKNGKHKCDHDADRVARTFLINYDQKVNRTSNWFVRSTIGCSGWSGKRARRASCRSRASSAREECAFHLWYVRVCARTSWYAIFDSFNFFFSIIFIFRKHKMRSVADRRPQHGVEALTFVRLVHAIV